MRGGREHGWLSCSEVAVGSLNCLVAGTGLPRPSRHASFQVTRADEKPSSILACIVEVHVVVVVVILVVAEILGFVLWTK